MLEFMGYALKPCNNGLAWESPFKTSKEDIFNAHGRLYVATAKDVYFDSWDFLAAIIQKISVIVEEKMSLIDKNKYEYLEFSFSLFTRSKESITKTIIEFIKSYNFHYLNKT
jgi:hypothetical protein